MVMNIRVLTPDRVICSTTADEVILPGLTGQVGDVVAFIYRDEVYNKEDDNPSRGTAEILLSKQRNGPTGDVHLAFLNSFTRFENLASEDAVAGS